MDNQGSFVPSYIIQRQKAHNKGTKNCTYFPGAWRGGACVHWISGPGSSLSSQPGSASPLFDPPTPNIKKRPDIKGLINRLESFTLEMQDFLNSNVKRRSITIDWICCKNGLIQGLVYYI